MTNNTVAVVAVTSTSELYRDPPRHHWNTKAAAAPIQRQFTISLNSRVGNGAWEYLTTLIQSEGATRFRETAVLATVEMTTITGIQGNDHATDMMIVVQVKTTTTTGILILGTEGTVSKTMYGM